MIFWELSHSLSFYYSILLSLFYFIIIYCCWFITVPELNLITGMYVQEKTKCIYRVWYYLVSIIHQGSWNTSSVDKGVLLYLLFAFHICLGPGCYKHPDNRVFALFFWLFARAFYITGTKTFYWLSPWKHNLFRSLIHHLEVVWPWASYLTSLCLSFFIYKME